MQGDALGGGFECALASDLIVAEERAQLGFPEILFNLFPGMGAYSLLSRRVGMKGAEKMILSARLYTAEELHELGVVDLLVEVLVSSNQGLIHFLSESLAQVPGITSSETFLLLKTYDKWI